MSVGAAPLQEEASQSPALRPLCETNDDLLSELEARLLLRHHSLSRCLAHWQRRLAAAHDRRSHQLRVAEDVFVRRLCYTLFRAWQWRFRLRVAQKRLDAQADAFAQRRVCGGCRYVPAAVASFRRWRRFTASRKTQMEAVCSLRRCAEKALLHRFWNGVSRSERSKRVDRPAEQSSSPVFTAACNELLRSDVQKVGERCAALHSCGWYRMGLRRSFAADVSKACRVVLSAACFGKWRRWRVRRALRAATCLFATQRALLALLQRRFLSWRWVSGLRKARRLAAQRTAVDRIASRALQSALGLRLDTWRLFRRWRIFRKRRALDVHISDRFSCWVRWLVRRRADAADERRAEARRRAQLMQQMRGMLAVRSARRMDGQRAAAHHRRARLLCPFMSWRAKAERAAVERALTAKAARVSHALRAHLALQRLLDNHSSWLSSAGGDRLCRGEKSFTAPSPSGIGLGGGTSPHPRSRSSSISSSVVDVPHEAAAGRTTVSPPRPSHDDYGHDAGHRVVLLRPLVLTGSPLTDASAAVPSSRSDASIEGALRVARRPSPIPFSPIDPAERSKKHASMEQVLVEKGQCGNEDGVRGEAGDAVAVHLQGFSQQRLLQLTAEYKMLKSQWKAAGCAQRMETLKRLLSESWSSDISGESSLRGELSGLRVRQQHLLALRSTIVMHLSALREAVLE
jgi:hypothetical protein